MDRMDGLMEVFVMNTKFLDFIKNDKTFLEREPLEIMTKENNLCI